MKVMREGNKRTKQEKKTEGKMRIPRGIVRDPPQEERGIGMEGGEKAPSTAGRRDVGIARMKPQQTRRDCIIGFPMKSNE